MNFTMRFLLLFVSTLAILIHVSATSSSFRQNMCNSVCGFCPPGYECRTYGCVQACMPTSVQKQSAPISSCADLEQCIGYLAYHIEGLAKVIMKSQTEKLFEIRDTFLVSKAYNGSRYYLQNCNSSFFTTGSAEHTCRRIGGRLALIENENELQFVKSFLKNTSFSAVFIAGSDEKKEGNWINTFTNTTLKYLAWASNEPDGGRLENFLALGKNADYGMIDATNNRSGTILCEVSQ